MSKQPTLTIIESLFSQTKEYVDNRLELYKLKMIDKTSNVASLIISALALFVVFFIFFIILNIGIALLIGELIGKPYAGFLILAAIYLIAGLVLLKGRNKLFKAPVSNMLIRKFL